MTVQLNEFALFSSHFLRHIQLKLSEVLPIHLKCEYIELILTMTREKSNMMQEVPYGSIL